MQFLEKGACGAEEEEDAYSSDDSIVNPNFNVSDITDSSDEDGANIIKSHTVTAPTVSGEKEIKKRLLSSSARLARDKAAHTLKCPCKCKAKCLTKITEERKRSIWEGYYKMTYNNRRVWVHNRIIKKE